MTPKEQAIKKAYGEYYDTFKNDMDQDGWVPETAPAPPEGMAFDIYRGAWMYWRPISLRGIETNNGWISVREGVPHDQQHCWFWIKEQGAIIGFWDEEGEAFFVTGVIMVPDAYGITHWQPVVKPEAPLY